MTTLNYENLKRLTEYLVFFLRLDEMEINTAKNYIKNCSEVRVFMHDLYNTGFILNFNWSDWLRRNDIYKNVESDLKEHIMKADLLTLRKIMTSYVRGDRFNDGLYEVVILKGHVKQILLRLKELLECEIKEVTDFV